MRPVLIGSTDVSVDMKMVDSTDFSAEVGVTSATAGLAIRYQKGDGALQTITPGDLAALNSAHSDGAIYYRHAGEYRLCIPDAAVPTSEGETTKISWAATGMHGMGAAIVGAYTIGAPAGASVSADIAAIEAQTDDIGAAGAGLTALGDARLANLDATVSSRGTGTALDAAGVRTAVGLASANLDTQIDALPTATENAAAVWTVGNLTVAAVNRIADVILRRTTANVEASSYGDTIAGRSLYGAVARLAHKVATSLGTMTVYKSDDSTSLTTATLTTDSAADPVTAIDPAA